MGLIEILGLKRKAGGAPTAKSPAAKGAASPSATVATGTAGASAPASQPPVPRGPPSAAPPLSPALAKQLADLDAALAAARPDIDALKTAALKASLTKEVEGLVAERDAIGKLDGATAAARATAALAQANALRTRVGKLRSDELDVLLHEKNWAVKTVDDLGALLDGKPAEAKGVLAPQLVRVRKRLADLRKAIESGDFTTAETISEEVFYATAGITRATNEFATDFPAYKVERDKAELAIRQLKSHAQAAAIGAEIQDLEDRLLAADDVASKADLKGWEKATVAVKQLPTLCARTKVLADKLQTTAAKLPALKKAFADAGADEARAQKMATYAQKMLVEENCSDADAIKMAKDADGFVKAGLSEPDAMMSSRVKRALVSGGTKEDVATEIGKNLRATGTSTAEDAKAVAQGMRNMSKKVLEDLNKAGIQTECCRGPVTEALPQLAGVQPRGWPAGSTWDQVPGVYSGSVKKVVVGTMEKDGKRKVPAKGEGPIPHGTPDLIGHEAGHAFDAADGTLKSKHAKFLEARTQDISTGNPRGMWGPRDNYFLATAEGGTNDAGATSETFAESFAMHFSGTSRWPKLEAFWAANPWGA